MKERERERERTEDITHTHTHTHKIHQVNHIRIERVYYYCNYMYSTERMTLPSCHKNVVQ
jgi:hypothetical protein